MTTAPPGFPQHVPVLTEVMEWVGAPPELDAPAPLVPDATLHFNDDALRLRVLGDLQQRIEATLEAQVREALAPLLAQAADEMVQRARQVLAASLRAAVAQAVAEELADELARARPA